MAASTPYQKLRAYTLWSVAGLLVVVAAIVFLPLLAPHWPDSAPALVTLAAASGTAAALYWRGVDVAVESRPLPRPLAVVHAVLGTGAVILVGVLAVRTPSSTGLSPGMIVAFAAILVLLPVSILVPMRVSLAVAAGTAGLAAVVSQLAQHPGGAVLGAVAGGVFLVAIGMFASFRGSVWILQLAREEATTAAMRADLAVAQERLRFSRDLHDIFGRTLTAVAVKSDLAAELADHGRAEAAAAEMRSVHELAQQALTDVRGVVAAMRTPDLATELAGARALLDSSGIAVTVVGEAADSLHAEVMGWVVREAVTKVLRHARATRCRIRVTPQALAVVSDGAAASSHADGTVRYGAGLAGLEDRVRAAGGRLDVTRDGDTFTVRASWEEQA